MNTVAQPEIIGLDVSRDWLGIHCLSDGRLLLLPNTDDGHSKQEEVAVGRICRGASGCEMPPGMLAVPSVPGRPRRIGIRCGKS